MKWIKRGLIFNPQEFNLENGCKEFAQSPQTVVFEDFVRIYFSTRKRDESGQYLSYITFIDMDLELKNIINSANEEVISLGELGTFDEHGIFPINPFKYNDEIYAFTCGWSRRISTPVETGIGLVKSSDQGNTFQRLGKGPIVSSSLHEPVLVGDAFVKNFDGKFYMWYMFGKKWISETEHEPAARVYKIGQTTSTDLYNWEKNDGLEIISNVLNEDECQALPTVEKIGNRYHMYFCFREATDFRTNKHRSYKLGYAYSDDLISWIRDDEKGGIYISENELDWDSEMLCYPHIFNVGNKTYLLYNGNQFGKSGFGLAELESDK